MTKRNSYLWSQGQGGIRSGVSLGIPFALSNPAAASAANAGIPVASQPLEVPIYTFPSFIAQDAFVATMQDIGQSAGDPPLKFAIQSIDFSLNAAFAAAAASFDILLRRYTAAGVLVGTVATLFAGVTQTSVAFARRQIAAAALIAAGFDKCDPGDSLALRIIVNGAGAVCPAFGGVIDVQG